MRNLGIRAAGIAVLLGAIWYLPWLYTSLNFAAMWVSIPFAIATTMLMGVSLLTAFNNWSRSSPRRRVVPPGAEPMVAVIIPTCGEPAEMVRMTAASVLGQDWPQSSLYLLIGDDAGNPELDLVAAQLRQAFPGAAVELYRGPPRGHPARRGEAKAGNLNAGMDLLDARDPDGYIAFVETRDADDLVGDRTFLRQCVAQLQHEDSLAYVQTVKEATTAKEDPFGNIDRMFFRGSMLARNSANAVFPCGSGLLWRRSAITHIGGFPTWNLVEDLQSGLEALRRGWHGMFLPIVGAHAQIAPEDIPNVYKQRGTWALDTVRLLIWGNWRGLNLRQRLQFLELGMFYLYGTFFIVFCASPVISMFFGVYPIRTNPVEYAEHFWPITIAIELSLLSLNSGGRWEDLWRARQMQVGMATVYARASVRAIFYGPRRKPVYRITRKTHEHRWYWRETLPQMLIVITMSAGVIFTLTRGSVLAKSDLGSVYWAVMGILLMAGFVAKGWFGVRAATARRAAVRRAAARQAAPKRHGVQPIARHAGVPSSSDLR